MGVVIAVVVVLGAFLLLSYNRFVEQRNLIRDSWSNIDTELQRRYDLIPSLVETAKGYAAHEEAVFAEVTDARARAVSSTGAPASQAGDENTLIGALRHLFAVVEAYPDLRASDAFLGLQRELANTEDRIQTARRFYNANVRELNRRIQAVPSNLVAGWFGFTEADYFQIEEAIRAAGVPPVRPL